jgi:hypothetical protein
MAHPVAFITVFSVVLAVSPPSAATEPADPTPQDVREHIRMLESSITESSVTHRYSEAERQAKLELLVRAQAEADQGNLDGAMDLVEQAGRMLYPMEMASDAALEGDKRREWLEQINRVTEAVLPAAYAIAEEKGRDTSSLDQVRKQQQDALTALEAGDMDRAETLFITAYNRLQSEVATLRSGDLLTIELPSNDTREAWAEAERRYLDWRFTADWMEQSAAALGADPEAIATGSRLADGIYQEAKALAEQEQWAKAIESIDRAYAVMEEHWRMAGIDI